MAGASLALVVFAGILVFGLRRADAPTGSVDEGSVGQGSATAQPSSGVAGPSQQRSSGTSFVKIVPVKVDDLDPAERAILESFGGPLFGGPS